MLPDASVVEYLIRKPIDRRAFQPNDKSLRDYFIEISGRGTRATCPCFLDRYLLRIVNFAEWRIFNVRLCVLRKELRVARRFLPRTVRSSIWTFRSDDLSIVCHRATIILVIVVRSIEKKAARESFVEMTARRSVIYVFRFRTATIDWRYTASFRLRSNASDRFIGSNRVPVVTWPRSFRLWRESNTVRTINRVRPWFFSYYVLLAQLAFPLLDTGFGPFNGPSLIIVVHCVWTLFNVAKKLASTWQGTT